jgi:hypothetical protein
LRCRVQRTQRPAVAARGPYALRQQVPPSTGDRLTGVGECNLPPSYGSVACFLASNAPRSGRTLSS